MANTEAKAEKNGEEEPIGHAVVDGRVRFLSVSAIQKFDREEQAGCPRAWWFRYVKGIKEPETEALRRGKEIAKELEHYLKGGLGSDVLSPVARAGKHLLPAPGGDLEIEQPLGDIRSAIKIRETLLSADESPAAFVHEARARIERFAGLTANHIPLMGAADFRHRRGEYVDADGILRKEDRGIIVSEIGDHKSTKRIDNHTAPSGKVHEGYAKTVEGVLAATQMVGYGVHAARRHPDLTHVRLSHIYYQKVSSGAAKRTGILPVEEVLRRWRRVDALAREIENVAQETDIAKIEPNLGACNAFHRPCPYTDQCPRSIDQVFSSMFSQSPTQTLHSMRGEPQMSLFNTIKKSAPVETPQVATVTPIDDVARRVAVDAEKKKIEAEDAKGCGAPGCGVKCAPGWVNSPEGGPNAFVICSSCKGSAAAIGAINPPDAPKYDLSDAADPLPPEVIATIINPELRAKAEAHAKAHAERAAVNNSEAEAKGGRCPGGNQRVTLTMDQVADRRMKCGHCGKEIGIKPAKIADGKYEATVTGHNLPKTETPPTPKPETKSEPDPRQTVISQTVASLPASSASAAPVAVAVTEKRATIFLDAAVIGEPQPKPLSSYYDVIVEAMVKEAGALDIRCAPDGSVLAFGKWKGALSAFVKSRPIAPGEYAASSSNEIDMIVIDALRVRMVRGVR